MDNIKASFTFDKENIKYYNSELAEQALITAYRKCVVFHRAAILDLALMFSSNDINDNIIAQIKRTKDITKEGD